MAPKNNLKSMIKAYFDTCEEIELPFHFQDAKRRMKDVFNELVAMYQSRPDLPAGYKLSAAIPIPQNISKYRDALINNFTSCSLKKVVDYRLKKLNEDIPVDHKEFAKIRAKLDKFMQGFAEKRLMMEPKTNFIRHRS